MSDHSNDEFFNTSVEVERYIRELKKIKNKISRNKGFNIDFAINVIKEHFNLMDDETVSFPIDAPFEQFENEDGNIVIKTKRYDKDGNIKDCIIIKPNV